MPSCSGPPPPTGRPSRGRPTRSSADIQRAAESEESACSTLRDAAGERLAVGRVDPRRAAAGHRPVPELAPGTYEVRWRAASADGHIEHDTWTFTVDAGADPVADARARRPRRDRRRARRRRPVRRPTQPTAARARRHRPVRPDPDGRRRDGDVILPIIAALAIVVDRGRVPARATRPPARTARDRAPPPPARRRSLARRGDRPHRAGRRPRPRAQPDLHEPAAAGGLPRRCGRDGRPVVRLRAGPRRPGRRDPIVRARAHLPPALVRLGLRAHRPHRLGVDRRPGHRRRRRATPTSRRCSCGSTAGSAWPWCPRSSGRSGTSWTRSRRSTTLGAAVVRRLGITPWELADYPAAARSLAGGHRLRRRRLARARPRRRPEHAVHRARRLHRADAWR